MGPRVADGSIHIAVVGGVFYEDQVHVVGDEFVKAHADILGLRGWYAAVLCYDGCVFERFREVTNHPAEPIVRALQHPMTARDGATDYSYFGRLAAEELGYHPPQPSICSGVGNTILEHGLGQMEGVVDGCIIKRSDRSCVRCR